MSDGKVPLVTSVSGVIPAELRLEDLQEEPKSLGELIVLLVVLLVVLQQKKKTKNNLLHIQNESMVRSTNFVTLHTRRNVSHNHGTHFTNPSSPIKAFRHGRVPLNKGSGGDSMNVRDIQNRPI